MFFDSDLDEAREKVPLTQVFGEIKWYVEKNKSSKKSKMKKIRPIKHVSESLRPASILVVLISILVSGIKIMEQEEVAT